MVSLVYIELVAYRYSVLYLDSVVMVLVYCCLSIAIVKRITLECQWSVVNYQLSVVELSL